MKEKLAALYALQQLDSALAALQKQYAALDKGATEQAAFETAQAAHQQAETALHTVSGSLRDAELEQKTVEAKRADFEKKLYGGSIRVPKELQAMQEEIEMLGRQRGRLDEQILMFMDDLETRRKEEAEAKQALKAAKSAFQEKRANYKQAAETLVAEARKRSAERAAAAKQIEPALLKRYESLRAATNGVAISPIIEGNACGGCRMALPSMLVVRVHEGTGMETCQNCGRLLCEAP